MYNGTRAPLIIFALVLLAGGALVWWQVAGKSAETALQSEKTEDTGVPMSSYRNDTYGYSFSYPSTYDLREYTPEYVSLGHMTANGFDALVAVGIAQSGALEEYGNFEEYLFETGQALCAADGSAGHVECDRIERTDAFPSAAGLSGTAVYLHLVDTRSGTTSSMIFGPLYAFNIAANTPGSKFSVLIIYPPVVHAKEQISAALAKGIADSLMIEKLAAR